ncbi:hypothetical protein NDU88_006861 [Pleurodeles waltl]|uniref:Uncharacterized protein n=1 Tax=Pleurodeles waltl TaxID=8319 RepID=A0AAV7NRH7_PLEWA|nr:hypothetical protein NDU88_006861 [Pleurodeles waltl]
MLVCVTCQVGACNLGKAHAAPEVAEAAEKAEENTEDRPSAQVDSHKSQVVGVAGWHLGEHGEAWLQKIISLIIAEVGYIWYIQQVFHVQSVNGFARISNAWAHGVYIFFPSHVYRVAL